VEVAPGGERVAAILEDAGGIAAVRLWRLDGDLGGAEVRSPAVSDPRALAFSTEGDWLHVGSEDGSISSWKVEAAAAGLRSPPAESAPIVALATTRDGSRLAIINEFGSASTFELDTVPAPRATALPLAWNSIQFLENGRVVGTVRGGEGGPAEGAPVAVDLQAGRAVLRPSFLPPRGRSAGPPELDRLAVSEDGRWVAACTVKERAFEAFVWDAAKGGEPVGLYPLRNGRARVDECRSLGVTNSGRVMILGSRWVGLLDKEGREGPVLDASQIQPDATDLEFTTAALGSQAGGPAVLVALGTLEHGIYLWNPDRDNRPTRLGGAFRGGVGRISLSQDGRWLVASGRDKSFRAWELTAVGGAREVDLDGLRPMHDGAIHDLREWPGGASMVASAGDDGTIRFWRLDRPALVGTIALGSPGRVVPGARPPWVAYTPDGRVDCEPGWPDKVLLAIGEKTVPLDQASDALRVEGLVDQIRTDKVPPPIKLDATRPPPEVALEVVAQKVTQGDPPRAARVQVKLNEPRLRIRLYQNGLLIRDDEETPGDQGDRRWTEESPNVFVTWVTLRPGPNQFHVVARREADSIENRSLVVKWDHPETPPGKPAPRGRVHILALGINAYRDRPRLNYAVRDARAVCDWIHQLDVKENGQDDAGYFKVLSDKEVTLKNVRDEFEEIRKKVGERDEDRVVLFVAGHTDASSGLSLALADGASLPFPKLLYELCRVNVKNRLLIVDGCQTGKLFDIGRKMGSQKSREATRYLVGSAPLEAAFENVQLKHGLLTYAVLKGLGDPERPPAGTSAELVERLDRGADGNRDNQVEVDELEGFTKGILPDLVEAFPRGDSPLRGPRDPAIPPATSKTSSSNFPLVRLPRR
jgi:WD40 repeat protein